MSIDKLAGLQGGKNWQRGRFVYGIEADFSWLRAKATANGTMNSGFVGGDYTYTYGATTARQSKVNELATFRTRFGIDFNGTLPYATVGLALGRIESQWAFAGYGGSRIVLPNVVGVPEAFAATKSSWVPGLAVGGGIEQRIDSQWSLRAEVLWLGFLDQKLANPVRAAGYSGKQPQRPFNSTTVPGYAAQTSLGGTINFHDSLTVFKIGLNYRF